MKTNKDCVVLDDVSYSYPGSKRILFTDVNIRIGMGEIAALRGKNGEGKSTLGRLITGNIRPTKGSVRLYGKDPVTVDRLPEVAVISEPLNRETGTFPSDLTAMEILELSRLLSGIDPRQTIEQMSALNMTPSDLQRPIHSYSKGERQRFNIAVCLSRFPKFLLADEPLDGVDSESRATICQRFRDFVNEGGAMLWISHYLDEALPLADRCYIFNNGRIEEEKIASYVLEIKDGEKVTSTRTIVTLAQVGSVLNELTRDNMEAAVTVKK